MIWKEVLIFHVIEDMKIKRNLKMIYDEVIIENVKPIKIDTI